MKRVRWSEQASIGFEGIIQYIADDNPFAAARVAERIQSAISKLRRFNTGRIGRVRGTFEKVVAKTLYIVAYSLERAASDETELVVLHIIHGARDWPEDRWPQD